LSNSFALWKIEFGSHFIWEFIKWLLLLILRISNGKTMFNWVVILIKRTLNHVDGCHSIVVCDLWDRLMTRSGIHIMVGACLLKLVTSWSCSKECRWSLIQVISTWFKL
jgi:hypothetical protein